MAGSDSLSSLRIGTGVVIAVTFHEVDTAPYAQSCADCRGEGGEGVDTGSEKVHDRANQNHPERTESGSSFHVKPKDVSFLSHPNCLPWMSFLCNLVSFSGYGTEFSG